jgi:hypothetical protein
MNKEKQCRTKSSNIEQDEQQRWARWAKQQYGAKVITPSSKNNSLEQ